MQVRDAITRTAGSENEAELHPQADGGRGAGSGREFSYVRAHRKGGTEKGWPWGGATLAVSGCPRPLSALAGTVILELSKEKTNERLLDRQAAAFTASVQHVEAELSAQIRYLTQVATGQPHEGSSYSSRKDCQMALKRVDYARLKLSDVARTCEQMLEN
ncbi:mediator of RNA polymerase II transcription subunit 11 isoform X1 [Sapajus apella]|uniref:Mediator of RNA polymerase II transcription subunit 11 n=1 Tax=Sapajus apella TaxID=9515 RepID=A0A6J3H3J7_SAPAP|nr:mediator of RNA polymerase II transcription subunit 11 isoform X1 [Sapajus apella]